MLFGPDMSDFREIAESLINAGAGHRVTSAREITVQLTLLLRDPELLEKEGQAALNCVKKQFGVVDKHLTYIDRIL